MAASLQLTNDGCRPAHAGRPTRRRCDSLQLQRARKEGTVSCRYELRTFLSGYCSLILANSSGDRRDSSATGSSACVHSHNKRPSHFTLSPPSTDIRTGNVCPCVTDSTRVTMDDGQWSGTSITCRTPLENNQRPSRRVRLDGTSRRRPPTVPHCGAPHGTLGSSCVACAWVSACMCADVPTRHTQHATREFLQRPHGGPLRVRVLHVDDAAVHHVAHLALQHPMPPHPANTTTQILSHRVRAFVSHFSACLPLPFGVVVSGREKTSPAKKSVTNPTLACKMSVCSPSSPLSTG